MKKITSLIFSYLFFSVFPLIALEIQNKAESQITEIRGITFTISDATDINCNSATFNVSVTSDGNVSDKGVCYSSINAIPTITDNSISEGSGVGSFTVTLTNLSENTQYYARPYAIENDEVFYSEVKIFTTLVWNSSFTISDATDINCNSATFTVSVTSNCIVSDKGICYSSVNPDPTITDNSISKGSGTENFTATLINLERSTQYYARPYAIVNENISYGAVKTFTTLYEGVKINGILWATRNVAIPKTFTDNSEDAGMFYQWGSNVGWSSVNPLTASDGINIWRDLSETGNSWTSGKNPCPTGWRVPTHAEQQNLINSGSFWDELNGAVGLVCGSGDHTIFLPAAGYRNTSGGSLFYVDRLGNYWSSSPYSTTAFNMTFTDGKATPIYSYHRSFSFPIRCVSE